MAPKVRMIPDWGCPLSPKIVVSAQLDKAIGVHQKARDGNDRAK